MDTIFLLAIDNWFTLFEEKLNKWLKEIIQMLPNVVLAALIFTFFFFVAKLIRRLFRNLLVKLSHKETISGLFSTVLYIVIVCIGGFISLDILHLEKAISSLLAGAGIVGLALGFAFQDLTANFISGVFIIFRKPFDVGQVVDTNGFVGTVEEIQLRSTTIRTFQGLHIMIPNKDVFQKSITNYSLSGERRIDIALTLPASTNPASLEAAIRASMEQIPEITNKEKVEMHFTDYNGDTMKLEVWCWVDNSVPKGFTNLRDKIIRQIHEAIQHQAAQNQASTKG